MWRIGEQIAGSRIPVSLHVKVFKSTAVGPDNWKVRALDLVVCSDLNYVFVGGGHLTDAVCIL